MPLMVSWVSFWKFWELLRHSTCLLLVPFSRNCSDSGFWSEVSFIDIVCEFTSFLCFNWGVCVFSLVLAAESFWILANLNYPQISPGVAARQHMGLVEYSSVGLRSLFRRENVTFLVKMLGCSLDTASYTVVCVLFLRFVLPGKSPVCCLGSNVTSLCGVVRFATCLTGRVESSRFSVNFVIVGVRVICVTVDISRPIWVAFKLLFVRQSVLLSFIRIFQTVKL